MATYKKSFHSFQKQYISKFSNSLKMRDYLKKFIKNTKNLSILDVGCGSGLDISFFKEIGFLAIAGIDVTKSLLDIARIDNKDVEFIHGDFNSLDWADSSFDVVWSKYALQVSDKPENAIGEIKRVLKPGGYAFIQVTHPFRTASMTKQKNYFSFETINYHVDSQIFQENHFSISFWLNTFLQNDFDILLTDEILNKNPKDYGKDCIITPSSFILILSKKTYEKN